MVSKQQDVYLKQISSRSHICRRTTYIEPIRRSGQVFSYTIIEAKLSELQNKFNISDSVITEHVKDIYTKMKERGLIRGYQIDAILVAIFYILCRDTTTPFTLNEVIEKSGIKRKPVTKYIRLLIQQHITSCRFVRDRQSLLQQSKQYLKGLLISQPRWGGSLWGVPKASRLASTTPETMRPTEDHISCHFWHIHTIIV